MLTVISDQGSRILAAMAAEPVGRRAAGRTEALCRLVKVDHDQNQVLARCLNLSNGGAKLDLAIALNLNDRITISFSPMTRIEGRVVWISGNGCGVAFDEPIDSGRLLRGDSLDSRQLQAGSEPANRARSKLNLPARVGRHGAARDPVVTDGSVDGRRIANDGTFHPGLNVRVILADGREQEGVVRWSRENIAGVLLLDGFETAEPDPVRQLGHR
ncbi:MAG: PilZ domain-containing protein [Novosphingobium sp.]